jgi:hypothetical protein
MVVLMCFIKLLLVANRRADDAGIGVRLVVLRCPLRPDFVVATQRGNNHRIRPNFGGFLGNGLRAFPTGLKVGNDLIGARGRGSQDLNLAGIFRGIFDRGVVAIGDIRGAAGKTEGSKNSESQDGDHDFRISCPHEQGQALLATITQKVIGTALRGQPSGASPISSE